MKTIISLDEWLKIYEDIAKRLKISIEEDYRATDLLEVLIRGKSLNVEVLSKMIKGKHVVVAGAGPSIIEDLENIKRVERKDLVFITCDGATKAFLEIFEEPPNIIVTDLDGFPKEQVFCNQQGSIIIVHAHGDNKEQIVTYVPKLKNIIGTTQVKPKGNTYNFGGFTDGDRAVFITGAFEPLTITLVGMDLTEDVGKYSKQIIFDRTKKIAKLKIAKELLELFATKAKKINKKLGLYNLTKEGENIEGFDKISVKDFVKIIYKYK
jgi:Uncharacterized Rossmann fold enzyme